MRVDLGMPKLDGTRLAELLRKALSEAILIAVTGFGGGAFEEAACCATFVIVWLI